LRRWESLGQARVRSYSEAMRIPVMRMHWFSMGCLRKNTGLSIIPGSLKTLILLGMGCWWQALIPGQALENSSLPSERIFEQLELKNREREEALREYSHHRTYRVLKEDHTSRAELQVESHYTPPGQKSFKTLMRKGSSWIHRFVFQRLLDAETDAASGKSKQDNSITSRNYTFRLLGEAVIRDYPCYVMEATPRRQAKYLFIGKIWIHKTDFAIVRIEGHPAKKVSMWVRRTDITRDYQKIGAFWLPLHDYTLSDVYLFGKNILEIQYLDYQIKPEAGEANVP